MAQRVVGNHTSRVSSVFGSDSHLLQPTEILDRVFAYSAPVSRDLSSTEFEQEFAAELRR